MSKDLVDASDFTSPIHVPEGLDSRDDAAGDVELIAQRLANRTRYLKDQVDPLVGDAARKSQDNTFVANNAFTQPIACTGTDPAAATIETPSAPGDLGTAWRLIGRHKHAGGLYIHLYTGSNASNVNGAFLICTNATWDVGASNWRKQQSGQDSVAMIWHQGKVRVSRVAANTAPWASWPEGFAVGYNVDGGGGFEALVQGNLRAVGDLRGANVRTAGSVFAGANFDGTCEFNYEPARLRTYPLDLALATGDVRVMPNGSLQVWENLNISAGMGQISVPLRVSRDSHIGNIEVMISQEADAPDDVVGHPTVAAVLMRNAPNWDSSPPVAGTTSLLWTQTSPASIGVRKLTLVSVGTKPDHRKEYSVVVKMNLYSRLLHIRVIDFEDFGPRNVFAGA